jgi:WD40 repeat protein
LLKSAKNSTKFSPPTSRPTNPRRARRPGKILKIYSLADPKPLHQLTQHTDWITAVAYSPDGVLLASGDRSGGLRVWEAGAAGGVLHTQWTQIRHLLASVSALTQMSWPPPAKTAPSSSGT